MAVKRLRNQLGISQEVLAELAELDRTYIGHVERGARNVSLSTIDKLARALKVSTATLLSAPGEMCVQPGDARRDLVAGYCVDILMVEDRQRDVELTLQAFKRAEISNSVHVVRDGAEALDFLFCTGRYASRRMEFPPELVLLDLQLPKVGGMEVLRRIKDDRRTRNIHVVVLTASRSDQVIEEAMRLDAAAFIIKPVDFQNFSEVTSRLNFRWALLEPIAPATG
jgi:two-component system, response regulator